VTDDADAAAIQAQGKDRLPHLGVMAVPTVAGDELTATASAAVALFARTTYAMLNSESFLFKHLF
jgi:hypothetical protein